MGDRSLHVGRPSIGSLPSKAQVEAPGQTRLPEHDDKSARQPPRVLIISGGLDLAERGEQLGRDLHAQGLQVQTALLSELQGETHADKLTRLELDLAEKFDQANVDHVIVHVHGMYGDTDMHYVSTQDRSFVVSSKMLLQRIAAIALASIAKRSTQCDAPNMPIFHVASCGIGLAREHVAGLGANMLFYAAKKECEMRDAFDTLSVVFRDVSTAYKTSSPQPSTRTLWLRALGTSGENLTCIDEDGIHVHGPLKAGELPDGRTVVPDDSKDQRDLNAKLAHGSLRSVKAIIEKYGKELLQKTSFRGRPVLHSALAASRDEMQKIAYLLELGLDINQPDEKGVTALHHSVVNLPPRTLQRFLEFSPDLKARTQAGYSALHLAVISRNLEKVNILVREMKTRNISIDLKDKQGRTALMSAAYLSTPEIIRLLLREGADAEMPGDRDGKSARQLALVMGKAAHQEAFKEHDASTLMQ